MARSIGGEVGQTAATAVPKTKGQQEPREDPHPAGPAIWKDFQSEVEPPAQNNHAWEIGVKDRRVTHGEKEKIYTLRVAYTPEGQIYGTVSTFLVDYLNSCMGKTSLPRSRAFRYPLKREIYTRPSIRGLVH